MRESAAIRVGIVLSLAGLLALCPANAAALERPQLQAIPAIVAPSGQAQFDAARGSSDSRLPEDERVLGIIIDDEPRAYALSDLSRAGGHVRELIHDSPVSVDVTADGAVALRRGAPVPEAHIESWASWSVRHRDTSVWRPSADAATAPSRPVGDVRITETTSYGTAISCALSHSLVASNGPAGQGLFVISGSLTNAAGSPVHHVVLRFELIDTRGKVVYREDGYNRSAEALAAPEDTAAGEVEPVASGATDTFRMILVSAELPRFESARVQVAAVY